ncbi:uncharacterized protein LOC118195058 [Stegodyphus dumicola]|uniref:uncharacterized protein LOC118195058 n=1 Tax=Stegodyphus dumicola TaxID=202533 RepID=UPI0015A9D0A4|nr:uncharacterized protein LOC118195058 [Stegodyphus dumicola]
MEHIVRCLLVSSLIVMVSCKSAFREKMFFLQRPSGEENKTLLVVTWSEGSQPEATGCEIFTDEELIQNILKLSPDQSVKKPSPEEMKSLLEDCTEISIRRKRSAEHETRRTGDDRRIYANEPHTRNGRRSHSYESHTVNSRRNDFNDGNNRRVVIKESWSNGDRSSINENGANYDNTEDYESATMTPPNKMEGPKKESSTTEGYDGLPVIFPGTKWCGAGDIAKNYDDLGLHQDTDRCCRAHDLCNDTLAPGETRNNLTNNSPFTKLSCKCDQEFYDCLDRVNSVTANTIGNMYFNLLKRECYKKDNPRSSQCKRYRSLLKITCKEYEKDANAPEVYQWVPAKTYKNLPVPGPFSVTLPF